MINGKGTGKSKQGTAGTPGTHSEKSGKGTENKAEWYSPRRLQQLILLVFT